MRAVWDSSSLKPLERLVALSFADHAGDQDFAWVSYPRLRERTGLSRDAIARAIEGLRAGGWLDLKDPTRQQRSPRYWLRLPAQQSVSRTAEDVQPPASRTAGYPQQSVSRTAEGSSGLPSGLQSEASSPSPELSSPPPDTSSPGDGPDFSTHYSTNYSADARGHDAARLAIPAAHRPAVLQLLATHGSAISEDDAAGCVAWVAQSRKPRGEAQGWTGETLSRYVSRFPPADIRSRAAQHRDATGPSPAAEARKCPHGILDGAKILGRGAAASRRCGRCEQLDPAESLHVTERAS